MYSRSEAEYCSVLHIKCTGELSYVLDVYGAKEVIVVMFVESMLSIHKVFLLTIVQTNKSHSNRHTQFCNPFLAQFIIHSQTILILLEVFVILIEFEANLFK